MTDVSSKTPVDELQAVANHLTFLGFETMQEEGVIRAEHPHVLSLSVKQMDHGLLHAGYAQVAGEPTAKLAFINALNQGALVARFYLDGDGDCTIEAWLPGGYERARYALFIDMLRRDLRNAAGHADAQDFFR